jgi:hypothetical protein
MYVLHMQTRRQRYSFRSVHISEQEMLNTYICGAQARTLRQSAQCTRKLVNNSCQLVAGQHPPGRRGVHTIGAPTGAFGRCTAMTKHLTSCICMVYGGGTIRASLVAAPKHLLTSVLGSPNIQVSAFQTRFRSGAAKRLSDVPIPVHRMPRGGGGQKWQQRTHTMTTDDCSAA